MTVRELAWRLCLSSHHGGLKMSDATGWRTAWMTLERIVRGEVIPTHILLGLISEFQSREANARKTPAISAAPVDEPAS